MNIGSKSLMALFTLMHRMATPGHSAAKRMRFTSPAHQLSDDKAAEIIREAQSVAFPWQEAVPQCISK